MPHSLHPSVAPGQDKEYPYPQVQGILYLKTQGFLAWGGRLQQGNLGEGWVLRIHEFPQIIVKMLCSQHLPLSLGKRFFFPFNWFICC